MTYPTRIATTNAANPVDRYFRQFTG